jgi:DNA-directed RNA polymerase subunit RPC12/RpoP
MVKGLQNYYLLIIIVLAWIVYRVFVWPRGNYAYKCSDCQAEFQLSNWLDYLGPHFFTHRYLRCPRCRRWGWAAVTRT